MLTPTALPRARQAQTRIARIIFDKGGLFVAVDGDSVDIRLLVHRALEAALVHAGEEVRRVGPYIARIGDPPVCHGHIVGRLLPSARERLIAVLSAAGYRVDE